MYFYWRKFDILWNRIGKPEHYLRDGPLEQWRGTGTFSAGRIFFTTPASAGFCFGEQFKSPSQFFFWWGGRRGVGIGGEYSTDAILILTLTTIWMPGTGFKFNHIIVNLHSSLMFRKLSILLIHCPGNKIHSWLVVNQVLGYIGSVQ